MMPEKESKKVKDYVTKINEEVMSRFKKKKKKEIETGPSDKTKKKKGLD